MSHPQPPQRQPTPTETINYAAALHNVSILLLVTCPILALIPPRKFDAYTIGLMGTTAYSANYLVQERSGRSMWQHVRGSSPSMTTQAGNPSPEQETEIQRQLREQRTQDLLSQRRSDEQRSILEQAKQSDGWRAQREKEVSEALEEGKGITDMVTDQIWEVWNWGKTKDKDEDD